MQNYLINKDTLAIIPEGKHKSIIFENEKQLVINKSPNYIIKSNCSMYGSSYKGRLDGTKSLTGYSYKAPIIIEDKSSRILFPTSSPRLENVAWINLENVDYAYQNKDDYANMIKFNNGQSVKIDSSLNILNNQILRATRLLLKINQNNA